jgi:asparagine synthase (glutamine-hydrolysing)
VTRAIAGVFDPRGQVDRARLAGALAGRASSIIELGPLALSATGSQPGTGVPLCLLGGYVDNVDAIGLELEAREGCSAEEVLAAGYLRWGEELLGRLRGDFVLLLWDNHREEGLIVRDQLGVRCLYIAEESGSVCFATEVCDLLALLRRRPAPDAAGVAHWVAVTNRPGAGTLYQGVRRLAPGGALHLSTRGGVRERRYWSPTFTGPVDGEEPERSMRLREEISRAVRARLAADGDTGVLMSGGLDSACVAAVAAQEAPARVRAFSGVFPEHPAVDESNLIEGLHGALALGGVTAEVRSGGLLASGLESLRAWQLPLLSWGDFWTLPLLRAASLSGVRVMLGGDGGDELFATRAYLLADRLRAGHPRQALALARELPGAGDRPPRRALLGVAAELALGGAVPYGLHAALRRPLARRALPAWCTRETRRRVLASEDPLAWKRLDGPRWWAHAAHGLTAGIEEVGIFELHRRRAALAGLEARHPLLDLDLVELVLRAPPRSTFDRHRNRPALRACMKGSLPDAVLMRRRKALFDSLIVDTLAGPDGAAVRRLLCDRRAELGGYVDLERVRSDLLEGNRGGPRHPFDWMQQVWRLASAECWLRAQSDPSCERLADLVRASPARATLRTIRPREEPSPQSDATPVPFSTLTGEVSALGSEQLLR